MSVPGAMAPVEIDGKLLVDGGIVNNLPIDEARKLCADVVIAVNISTPALKREEITSAVSVSLQLINLLGKANVDQQLKSLGERDVLIEPQLGDISAGSFDRAADAIRIGEDATRSLAEKLKRYSLPPEQYAALRSQQNVGRAELGTVDEIRFEGLHRSNPEVLRPLVYSQAGEPLNEERIAADLRRIGLGSLLIARVQAAAAAAGFRRSIFALMSEDNASRRISDRYATTMRRYTLFARELSR